MTGGYHEIQILTTLFQYEGPRCTSKDTVQQQCDPKSRYSPAGREQKI
jgi:hypothetical protein